MTKKTGLKNTETPEEVQATEPKAKTIDEIRAHFKEKGDKGLSQSELEALKASNKELLDQKNRTALLNELQQDNVELSQAEQRIAQFERAAPSPAAPSSTAVIPPAQDFASPAPAPETRRSDFTASQWDHAPKSMKDQFTVCLLYTSPSPRD